METGLGLIAYNLSSSSSSILDQDLDMLKHLEVNLTCSECLEVCPFEDGGLESLQSCGHTFCLRCINERLDKIKLPFKNQPNKTQLLSGDPKTASRRLSLLMAVRCSTCHKLSKHPLLLREIGDNKAAAVITTTSMSAPSSVHSSTAALLLSDKKHQQSCSDLVIARSDFNANKNCLLIIRVNVRDLYGRTALVILIAADPNEQRFGNFKQKLARLLKMSINDLQIRGEQQQQHENDDFLLYDSATLRLVNLKPSSAWWWRPAPVFAGTRSVPLFARH